MLSELGKFNWYQHNFLIAFGIEVKVPHMDCCYFHKYLECLVLLLGDSSKMIEAGH